MLALPQMPSAPGSPPKALIYNPAAAMMTRSMFDRNPQLEKEIIRQASENMIEPGQKSDVASGKMEIVEFLPEVWIEGGMYHFGKIKISEKFFQTRIRHMVLPPTMTVEKVLGPMEEKDPVNKDAFR